jgi:hypothetical protein
VQYDQNDVNGSRCGQEANNNKNMKGYWDKQHRGSTCSCRLQDGNNWPTDVNFQAKYNQINKAFINPAFQCIMLGEIMQGGPSTFIWVVEQENE